MKILAIASYKIYPSKMGGQKGIALFYKYFGALAKTILITTKNNEAPPADYPTEVRPILSNGKFKYANPIYFFTLKKIIKDENITHVILEHPYYGWLGYLLKKFTKVKLVLHGHNIEGERFKSNKAWFWKILLQYEKWVSRKADHVFFIHDEDKNYAIKNFGLLKEKCHTITYGIPQEMLPNEAAIVEASRKIRSLHNIPTLNKVLLFNGSLDYEPNIEALQTIIKEINPRLQALAFNYTIIICGNKLPVSFNNLEGIPNLLYAGFVDDIDLYFKGCDVFINPVIEGGGIKTKLVEAIGFGNAVVTTSSGAIGVPAAICQNTTSIISDGDWDGFANAITKAEKKAPLSEAFFDYFYWGAIAKKAYEAI
jgi:polysaccharide biosynthesis protein PslH